MISAHRGLTKVISAAVKVSRIQQNQRKLSALALTSLVNVTLKRKPSFITEKACYVNKFDLSGLTGLVASQPALFSTVNLDTSVEEVAESSEEDNESVRFKWPSPNQRSSDGVQLTRPPVNFQMGPASSSVFVGGKSFNFCEEHLKNIFSQFGDVEKVFVPQIARYEADPNASDHYRWAFISFKTKAAMENALNAGVLNDGDSVIEIKPKQRKSSSSERTSYQYKLTLMVYNLPVDVTVNNLVELFKPFGLEFVNLVYDGNSEPGNKKNFAFVVLDSEDSVYKALDGNYEINEHAIQIRRTGPQTKFQPRDRSKKILVQGFPEIDQEGDSLKEHFSTARQVYMVKNVSTGGASNIAIVEFHSQEEAYEAANKETIIDGISLTVKALGWSS